MNDDDPQAVKRMLVYLYTLDYPDEGDSGVPAEHLAVEHSPQPHFLHETSTTTEEGTVLGTNLERSDDATLHSVRMMNNVLVYAIADKYDIVELKELAKRKFQTVANSKWPHDNFLAVVREVFSTTPDGDMGLRQVVLDACRRNFQEILEDEESRSGFLANTAIAAEVSTAAVRKIKEDRIQLDEALARRIAMRNEVSRANENAKEALDQKDELESRLDSIIKNANAIEQCRHCHKRFDWALERGGYSGFFGGQVPAGPFPMQIRCMGCRTKEVL